MTKCSKCSDTGWVCENHQDVPWEPMAGHGCGCGAGMPCECNDANPPWNYIPPTQQTLNTKH